MKQTNNNNSNNYNNNKYQEEVVEKMWNFTLTKHLHSRARIASRLFFLLRGPARWATETRWTRSVPRGGGHASRFSWPLARSRLYVTGSPCIESRALLRDEAKDPRPGPKLGLAAAAPRWDHVASLGEAHRTCRKSAAAPQQLQQHPV